MPIYSIDSGLPASPCATIAPSALSVCAVLCHRRRRRRRSSSGVIATLLSVAACHWYCCYDVMLLCGVTYNSCLGAPALSEINRNWNKAPARGQNEPPSILETNLGPPWKYLPWSERVAILSWLTSWLPKLIVASASLVWTSCLWLGVDVKPNDVDVIVNSNSVFVASRSSVIRQLESLNDLCDSDQSKLSDVVSK